MPTRVRDRGKHLRVSGERLAGLRLVVLLRLLFTVRYTLGGVLVVAVARLAVAVVPDLTAFGSFISFTHVSGSCGS